MRNATNQIPESSQTENVSGPMAELMLAALAASMGFLPTFPKQSALVVLAVTDILQRTYRFPGRCCAISNRKVAQAIREQSVSREFAALSPKQSNLSSRSGV
jgi:hypothetical protein